VIVLHGIADGMHSQRVMHRNLKPSNVLLDENFWPLIGDVGFAREFFRDPVYMAPELLAGAHDKSEVGVFAYGRIVFYVVIGRPALPQLHILGG